MKTHAWIMAAILSLSPVTALAEAQNKIFSGDQVAIRTVDKDYWWNVVQQTRTKRLFLQGALPEFAKTYLVVKRGGPNAADPPATIMDGDTIRIFQLTSGSWLSPSRGTVSFNDAGPIDDLVILKTGGSPGHAILIGDSFIIRGVAGDLYVSIDSRAFVVSDKAHAVALQFQDAKLPTQIAAENRQQQAQSAPQTTPPQPPHTGIPAPGCAVVQEVGTNVQKWSNRCERGIWVSFVLKCSDGASYPLGMPFAARETRGVPLPMSKCKPVPDGYSFTFEVESQFYR